MRQHLEIRGEQVDQPDDEHRAEEQREDGGGLDRLDFRSVHGVPSWMTSPVPKNKKRTAVDNRVRPRAMSSSIPLGSFPKAHGSDPR